MLAVEIRPNTSRRIGELCRLYWLQPDRPTKKRPFVHTVEQLGRRYNLSKVDVGRTVERHCYAYFPTRPCERCGGIVPLHIRSDYELHRYGQTVCGSCPWQPDLPDPTAIISAIEDAAQLSPHDKFAARLAQSIRARTDRAEVRARHRYRP